MQTFLYSDLVIGNIIDRTNVISGNFTANYTVNDDARYRNKYLIPVIAPNNSAATRTYLIGNGRPSSYNRRRANRGSGC